MYVVFLAAGIIAAWFALAVIVAVPAGMAIRAGAREIPPAPEAAEREAQP